MPTILLQTALTLLMSAQNGNQMTLAAREHLVVLAEQSIQLAVQDMTPLPFAVIPNNSAFPNIIDLQNAPYRTTAGTFVAMNQGVAITNGDIAFGDLNGDGVDDAAVVVEQTPVSGAPTFALAAMLNQGGILFNIADLPLGSSVSDAITNTHVIQNGDITLGSSTYRLLGDTILPVTD